MNGEPAKNERRFVRWAVVLSVLLAALVVAAGWQYNEYRPQLTAGFAQDAAREGQFDLMQQRLDELAVPETMDVYYDAALACAAAAYSCGEYDIALEVLASVPEADTEAYAAFAKKVQSQSAVYTYRKAEKLFEEGSYARAAQTAAQVRWYQPAQELYDRAQAAYQASMPTPTPMPVATPVPTATPRPGVLVPQGRLAAGFAHTVVLMDDGTVRAFGDNSCGQLDVQEWRDVVYVAAGAYHTLGLTADGRVLACGDNSHLQADVAFFSGVKAIAAGDYATFVLLESGQVLAAGYQEYAFLQDMDYVQEMWAGSYGVLVKTPQGVQASHPGLDLNGTPAVAAVSRGYAVAADSTGRTYSSSPVVPVWTGIERLAAGENAVLGLTHEGDVLAHPFGRHNTVDFVFTQPVAAIAAGPNHYAFLLDDGVLEIRRSNGESERYPLN